MRPLTAIAVAAALSMTLIAQQPAVPNAFRDDSDKWVRATLRSMTVDEKVGQMLVSSFQSSYLSTDSRTFDELANAVRAYHVGGFHVFGASEPVPNVLLNAGYGSVTLGQPLEAASILNRLQAISPVPLLNSADFETGAGFRLSGATNFPRMMAFGAARDEELAYAAGRVAAEESRAIGVHVNFAPVVDVNNNPRNPVINTRSFGEDSDLVGRLASAFVRGMAAGGMLATLKHFPGHGDTATDSHLGLPIIEQPRERIERLELAPFRAAIAAGAAAVMTGHIEMPALDPTPNTPTTLSEPIVTGLLRNELGFNGLVFTDSMGMAGVTALFDPGEAAVRAVKAGNDVVLHSPDDERAFAALREAAKSGAIPMARIDASVERILRAKTRVGLQRSKLVSLDAIPNIVGTRANFAVAQQVSERSITLIKDERNEVPLKLPRDAQVMYLSVLDYPGGWGIAAPSRTFIPQLRQRWPNVTAVEISDRSTPAELELVRSMVPRFDAVIASVFVRSASGSGRLDLAQGPERLLQDIARMNKPFVTTFFGNPYVTTSLPELPAMLLTYDFYDLAETSAVRAITGEIPIRGKLPIALPGVATMGFGLARSGPTQ
jgi:beta-N-acetylhexosaminidase